MDLFFYFVIHSLFIAYMKALGDIHEQFLIFITFGNVESLQIFQVIVICKLRQITACIYITLIILKIKTFFKKFKNFSRFYYYGI